MARDASRCGVPLADRRRAGRHTRLARARLSRLPSRISGSRGARRAAVDGLDRWPRAACAVDPGAAHGNARDGARRMSQRLVILAIAALLAPEIPVLAHSGPPFPIVSDRIAGAYRISIWTDPDTTDDGKPAGQFWVTLDPASGTGTVPAGTRAAVAIR